MLSKSEVEELASYLRAHVDMLPRRTEDEARNVIELAKLTGVCEYILGLKTELTRPFQSLLDGLREVDQSVRSRLENN